MFYCYVVMFSNKNITIPNWKMPTLNAFIESLTNEHDKNFQMGSMRSSKDQDLFDGGPNFKFKGKAK